ncbi:type II toxin-antitoxin system VapB family antitoxin [Cyclobacterium sp.]|uniref:type II toxin-antitoxin system VapB family antitoxin n=1 Tax=Cyclobacterium sp. TaxID=1966343 RepID=UPI0019C944B2|nr:type II toxin-antitoxin system VapB family antitoxin [Cyclobacterium sp.]MBD3627654.1 type II toxin-antitoxin system VapB family antitoxin [Cyclobacterium sp.]
MRTTLEIPEMLIKEAMELTGAKTKSQLIKEARPFCSAQWQTTKPIIFVPLWLIVSSPPIGRQA